MNSRPCVKTDRPGFTGWRQAKYDGAGIAVGLFTSITFRATVSTKVPARGKHLAVNKIMCLRLHFVLNQLNFFFKLSIAR